MKKQFKNVAFLAVLAGGVSFTSCNNVTEKANTVAEKGVEAVENVVEEVLPKVVYDTASPKSMLMAVAEACGGTNNLKALKDVEFDYHYISSDGKKDISKERYIFENETSWAKYSLYETKSTTGTESDVVQFLSDGKAMCYNSGVASEDAKTIAGTAFLRHANYMWFNMMFKLTDPGTIHEYRGQQEIDGTIHDIVAVSYDPAVTGKEINDKYILYINPETHMIDQFNFSVPFVGVNDPILLAKVTYTEVDGIKVMSRREMFAPSGDGEGFNLIIDEVSENIKLFNVYAVLYNKLYSLKFT